MSEVIKKVVEERHVYREPWRWTYLPAVTTTSSSTIPTTTNTRWNLNDYMSAALDVFTTIPTTTQPNALTIKGGLF